MPNTVSAKKKTRADARKKVINRRIKGKVKLALKGFVGSPSPENLSKVYSVPITYFETTKKELEENN